MYATEHILEFLLLKIFLEAKSVNDKLKYKGADGITVKLCDYMRMYWAGNIRLTVDSQEGTPIDLLPKVFQGRDNTFVSKIVLLEKYVNGMKDRMNILCSSLSR